MPEALEDAEAVRGFLASAVPQRLKDRALSQLWRLNPVLANLDGLVDYGEDFTDAATVIEGLQTAYEVGRGMLARAEALAEEALEEPMEDAAPAEDEDAAMIVAAAPVEAREEMIPPRPLPELAEAGAQGAEGPEAPQGPIGRRRMTFTFETS